MNEKLCFVQFLHPGGEHGFDEPGLKQWNRGDHKRKFIRTRGRIVDASNQLREDEVVFWGEWEAPSRVENVANRILEGPRFIHEPLLPPQAPREWRQNTDPFVFGDTFHYTGCLQHTKFGPTQLRYLAPGSVILFGSCIGRSRFVIDTVLVVSDHIDHSLADYKSLLGKVSRTYFDATIAPWYSDETPISRSHRLYLGASFSRALGGMFSFFPALPVADAPDGFARPTIDLAEVVTPTMSQGKRLNPQGDILSVRELWQRVVEQVFDQSLDLGVYAELPPTLSIDDDREPSQRRPHC